MAITRLRPQALHHNIALKILRFLTKYLLRALIRKPIYNLYNYIVQKKNIYFKGRSQLAVPKPKNNNNYIKN